MVARHDADHALPARGAAIAGGEAQIRPALIDKDQPRRIQLQRLDPPRGTLGLIALTGAQDFF